MDGTSVVPRNHGLAEPTSLGAFNGNGP